VSRVAGQIGPGRPTRDGHLLLATECGKCKARFSTPTQANVHFVKQHSPIKIPPSEGKSIWGVRWNADGSLGEVLRGPKPENNEGKTDPSAISETSGAGAVPEPESPYRDLIWGLSAHRCVWCGKALQRAEADGHHILPRSLGGDDDPRNLWLVHRQWCHDEIETWTDEHGRAPGPSDIHDAREYGYIRRLP